MRFVFDTNVLISAFITQGYCHEIYEYAYINHTLVISRQIITELKYHLNKKFHYPTTEVTAVIAFVKAHSQYTNKVTQLDQPVCRDRDDDGILALAVQQQVAAVFTGDQDLLSLHKYCGIPILSPNTFWVFEAKQRE